MALSRSFILLAVTLCLTQVWAQYQPKCGSQVMYVINADSYWANYGNQLLNNMAGTPSFSWFDASDLSSGPYATGNDHYPSPFSFSVEGMNAIAKDIQTRKFDANTRITLVVSAYINNGYLTNVDTASAVVAAANRLKSESNVEIFIVDYPEGRSNVGEFNYKLAQDIASNPVESHLFFDGDIYEQVLAPAFAGVSSFSFATIGDPYISTLDGNVYNFQGLGEFTLYRGDDYIMQVRMAPCDNSNPSSRTCNRAIALKSADSGYVWELHYDPVAQYLSLYENGNLIDMLAYGNYYYAGQYYYNSDFEMYIEKYDTPIDSDTVFLATFQLYSSGYTQLQVGFGNKVGLAVSGTLSPVNFGRVQGLVGTWDGCADNDYYSHNQTYTSPSASSRDIYFNFADTWRVSEAESLFTHGVNAKYYMPYFDELSPSWNPAFSGVNPSANAGSDCSFFKDVSPVLYFACMDDVSKGNGDIRPIGYMLTSIACADYCDGGIANYGYVSESYCKSTCAKSNDLDFHFNYNETNSDLYTLTTTSVGATFSATLGGTYTYSLTSDFCPDAAVTGTVQITCDQPPVVSAGDDRVIQKHAAWQWPIAVLMGSASDVNNNQLQYSWTFLSAPGLANYTPGVFPPATASFFPDIYGARSLTPYFYIEYPGDYVLELSVYDGCFFSKDTVTVHAVCGGCQLYVESAEIQDQTYESAGATDTWQGVSFQSRVINFDYEFSDNVDYHWFIDSNSRGYNFTYPAQSSTDVYTFTVTPAEQPTGSNSTAVVTSSSSSSTNTAGINTANIFRYEGLAHLETDTSVVRTTTTTVEYFSSVPIPVTMCTITISNAASTTPTFTVSYDLTANVSRPFTQTPSCVGDYTVRVAARDECNTAYDLANFHLGCSEQPQAHLISCQKTVQFNYGTKNFPLVALDGRDTFDPDTPIANLQYQWEIQSPNGVVSYYDCGAEVGLSHAYVGCNQPSIRPAAGAGTYTITMWVSDGCTYDYESTTIIGQCNPLSVSASVVNVNQDPDFPATGTANFTADFVTASTAQDAAVVDSWLLVSAPVGSNLAPSLPTQSMTPTNATATFYFGGSYTYMYSANDGCTIASQNVTVTYTCSSTMSFGLSADLPSQVFAVGSGVYDPVTITVNMNQTVNFNNGRAQIKATLVSKPLGSVANIASNGVWRSPFPGGANPTIGITPDVPGTYIVQVYVSDSCNLQVQNISIDASCPAAQVPTINNVQSTYTIPSLGSVMVDNLYIDESFSNYTITWTLTEVASNTTSLLLTGVGKTNVTFFIDTTGTYVVNVRATTPLAACFADAAAPVTITATCNYTLGIDAPTASIPSNMVRGKFERVTVRPTFTGVDPAWDPMSNALNSYGWRFLSAPEGSVFAPTYQNVTTVTVNSTTPGGYVYNGLNWTRTTTSILEFQTVVKTKYVTLVYNDAFDTYDGCFAPDVAGTYTLQFSITDYCGKLITQTYTVSANCNTAPSATAGSAATYTFTGTGFSFGTYKFTAIPLNGTASDPDNDFLDFQWNVISQPNNATGAITINNPQSKLATFVPTQVGTYVLQFQATDGCSTTNSTVAITVVCPATFQVNAPISFTSDGYTPVALQEFSLMANPQCTRSLYWTVTSYSPATAIPPPSATTTEAPKSGASQIAIPAFLVAFLTLFVKMF